MNHVRHLFALVAIVAFSGCGDSTGPDDDAGDIHGQVVDPQGQPLAGVTVVLQHFTDPPPGGKQMRMVPAIRFDLADATRVALWVSSYCDGDTLNMLVDGDMPMGQHAVAWTGTDDLGRFLPDGVYWVHLVTADDADRWPFVLLHLGYGDFSGDAVLAPLAVTDDEGRYRITQECLPFDYAFDLLDEEGNPDGTAVVTRKVRVWACDAAAELRTGSAVVVVDPDEGAEVSVTLGR